MGIDASGLGDEAEKFGSVHRCCVRWTEIIGDQKMLVVRADRSLVGLKVPENPLANIVDIKSTLPEVAVGNPTHCFEEGLNNRVEAELGVLLAIFDGLADFFQKAGVFNDQAVSFEDKTFVSRSGDALNVLL